MSRSFSRAFAPAGRRANENVLRGGFEPDLRGGPRANNNVLRGGPGANNNILRGGFEPDLRDGPRVNDFDYRSGSRVKKFDSRQANMYDRRVDYPVNDRRDNCDVRHDDHRPDERRNKYEVDRLPHHSYSNDRIHRHQDDQSRKRQKVDHYAPRPLDAPPVNLDAWPQNFGGKDKKKYFAIEKIFRAWYNNELTVYYANNVDKGLAHQDASKWSLGYRTFTLWKKDDAHKPNPIPADVEAHRDDEGYLAGQFKWPIQSEHLHAFWDSNGVQMPSFDWIRDALARVPASNDSPLPIEEPTLAVKQTVVPALASKKLDLAQPQIRESSNAERGQSISAELVSHDVGENAAKTSYEFTFGEYKGFLLENARPAYIEKFLLPKRVYLKYPDLKAALIAGGYLTTEQAALAESQRQPLCSVSASSLNAGALPDARMPADALAVPEGVDSQAVPPFDDDEYGDVDTDAILDMAKILDRGAAQVGQSAEEVQAPLLEAESHEFDTNDQVYREGYDQIVDDYYSKALPRFQKQGYLETLPEDRIVGADRLAPFRRGPNAIVEFEGSYEKVRVGPVSDAIPEEHTLRRGTSPVYRRNIRDCDTQIEHDYNFPVLGIRNELEFEAPGVLPTDENEDDAQEPLSGDERLVIEAANIPTGFSPQSRTSARTLALPGQKVKRQTLLSGPHWSEDEFQQRISAFNKWSAEAIRRYLIDHKGSAEMDIPVAGYTGKVFNKKALVEVITKSKAPITSTGDPRRQRLLGRLQLPSHLQNFRGNGSRESWDELMATCQVKLGELTDFISHDEIPGWEGSCMLRKGTNMKRWDISIGGKSCDVSITYVKAIANDEQNSLQMLFDGSGSCSHLCHNGPYCHNIAHFIVELMKTNLSRNVCISAGICICNNEPKCMLEQMIPKDMLDHLFKKGLLNQDRRGRGRGLGGFLVNQP